MTLRIPVLSNNLRDIQKWMSIYLCHWFWRVIYNTFQAGTKSACQNDCFQGGVYYFLSDENSVDSTISQIICLSLYGFLDPGGIFWGNIDQEITELLHLSTCFTVSPTVIIPISSAVSRALIILAEFPEVDIAMRTSPRSLFPAKSWIDLFERIVICNCCKIWCIDMKGFWRQRFPVKIEPSWNSAARCCASAALPRFHKKNLIPITKSFCTSSGNFLNNLYEIRIIEYSFLVSIDSIIDSFIFMTLFSISSQNK